MSEYIKVKCTTTIKRHHILKMTWKDLLKRHIKAIRTQGKQIVLYATDLDRYDMWYEVATLDGSNLTQSEFNIIKQCRDNNIECIYDIENIRKLLDKSSLLNNLEVKYREFESILDEEKI